MVVVGWLFGGGRGGVGVGWVRGGGVGVAGVGRVWAAAGVGWVWADSAHFLGRPGLLLGPCAFVGWVGGGAPLLGRPGRLLVDGGA